MEQALQEVSDDSQLVPTQVARNYTHSETMSSPNGSVGQLTPSPKQKAKSLHKRRQSALRNQYVPSPTTDTPTVETPDDIDDNSGCNTSAEAMSMADNGLQNYCPNPFIPETFTNHNDQSNIGLHCEQNLGYQDSQLLNMPYPAVYPANQLFNTGPSIGYRYPISQLIPQQHAWVTGTEAGNVNCFDTASMARSAASNFGNTNPASKFKPQNHQAPVYNVETGNMSPYNQPQASSTSSHMMSNNSLRMKGQTSTPQDQQNAEYFDRLLNAMKDVEKAEDNAGMLDTWEKMMNMKKSRIEQVCHELVQKAIEAQQKAPAPLGENGKYSIVSYDSVEDRVCKLESVLATQKTVCKHLLEDSYINQVVTDPESAQRRVENNRRVNYQKKQAIEEGRKRIGTKGRGKGVPVRALAKASIAQQESGDECVETSGNTNNSPENLGQSATKRRYSDVANEDNFDAVIKESPSKRAKTHSRTKSASHLTIDTVAASPMNTRGAPRASGHRYTNSYPAYDTTLAPAPVSGLPLASSNRTEYNSFIQQFQSPSFEQAFLDYQDSNELFSSEGIDTGGHIQSHEADN